MTTTTTLTLSDKARDYLAKVGTGIAQIAVQWESTVAPAAKHRGTVLTKQTTCIALVGAEYADLAVNEGKETGELPWGEWNVRPHIITHKGADYIRIYAMDKTLRTVYRVNGEVVDRDKFAEYLTPSAAKAKRPVGGTMTIKAENLVVLS